MHHPGDDAGMIGFPVSVNIKENDISLSGSICIGRIIPLITLRRIAQCPDPALTIRILRKQLRGNLCIIQAECDKHGIPAAVSITIPCAIARIAFYFLRLIACVIRHNPVIVCALFIVQLHSGNRKKIIRIYAGQSCF